MSTTSLIVELVLTGGIWLAAILIPGLDSSGHKFDLSAEVAAILLGICFFLGVVLDRASDNILSRWESLIRCDIFRTRHGKIPQPLKELIEEKKSEIKDPFPEGWMRSMVMTGPDGIVDWLNQLRIRTRIARSLSIALPAITCSAEWTMILAQDRVSSWPYSKYFSIGASLLIMMILSIGVLTHGFGRIFSTDLWNNPNAPTRPLWINSPAAYWFIFHLLAGGAAVTVARDRLPEAIAIYFAGCLLTAISTASWWSIIKTYHSYLWHACRTIDAEGLKKEILQTR